MWLIALVLGLLVVAIALALLAQRIRTPYPVLLVVVGLGLGVAWGTLPIPGGITVPPDLVFLVFLPPLLVSAAYNAPLGAFRANLGPITWLATALVLATMVVVAEVAVRLVPGMPRPAAYVLGAIVSPPDPVAATAIARALGLPTRIVTILEGEGLVNDATALVAYRLAIVAVISGHFAWSEAAGELLRAVVAGVPVGLTLGWLTSEVVRRIDDAVIETMITLVVPYVAYLVADVLGGSAVLSVVALGFYMGRRSVAVHVASTRLAMRTVWETLVFLITALVFILIGIQLGETTATGLSGRLLLAGAVVCLAAILLRLVWMFVVPRVVRWVTRAGEGNPLPSWRELTVLGWSGMRGVVSLAAALAVPAAAGRAAFPARGAIVVITFVVLFGTLVVQGLTLAPLVRALGIADPERPARDELLARERAIDAGRRFVDGLRARGALSAGDAEELRRELACDVGLSCGTTARSGAYRTARRGAVEVERRAVTRLRNDGAIDDAVARRLESELDLEAVQLRMASTRTGRQGRVEHDVEDSRTAGGEGAHDSGAR